MSGRYTDYSHDKTDLFDLTKLFPKNFIILRKLYSETLKNHEETFLPQPISFKTLEETIQKLTQERDVYKAKFNKLKSKYNDIKEKYDEMSTLKWSVVKFVPSYLNISKKCLSCLHKKFEIVVFKDQENLSNKRSEIISKCRHANKYLLRNYKTND